MTATTYPVRVDARLDPHLSRWLWLVKWFLIIPHYVVLFFLWIAFTVVSIVAFFAILFTGRYPRAIFEFNVGVLRWTWRVNYYAYSALGTDRYPPFTLGDVPDYPARLEVPYPEHLSRGLVLVKWWLLALPHLLIVGIFVGGGAWFAANSDTQGYSWTGGGLIGLLVLVSAIMLAVTGRYPQRPLRLHPRPQPVGAAGSGVHVADDGRLPALPAGRRRRGPRDARDHAGSTAVPRRKTWKAG